MQTIPAKTIITRTKSPGSWFGADYNMNIYRGCSHGCIYCDSRSECYRNTGFGTVKPKENALQIIRDELRRKVKTGIIATGSMSDPYNPLERELRLTRNALELVSAYGFGIAIATKSALVTRDIDVLREIKAHSPAIVKITVTTADDDVCGKTEPHVSTASERFDAIKQLSGAGIFCGVLMMPVLPFIGDNAENVTEILNRAKAAGAKFVYPAFGMTLRTGNREYYYEKLDEHFPGLKQKYADTYGNSYECRSPRAKQLWGLFAGQCHGLGLLYDMKSIIRALKSGYDFQQINFFND